MCGLVGVLGTIGQDQRKVFRQLLYVNALRGMDSTGVVKVGFSGGADWYKRAYPALDALDNKQIDKLINGYGDALMGHNRAATIGGVVHENAHPFEVGDVIGMHNGTLSWWDKLIDSEYYTVDSECLYNHINEKGLKDAMDNCRGAYALTWYDQEEMSFNFYRNDQREFHFCFSKSGTHMYYASEGKMLEWILDRNSIKHTEVKALAPHKHSKITINDAKAEQKFTIVTKKVVPNPPKAPSKNNWLGQWSRSNNYYYGDKVVFTLDSTKQSQYVSNHLYAYGKVKDGTDTECRVLLTEDNGLEQYVGKDCSFAGKVQYGGYDSQVTILPTSVVVSVPDDIPELQEPDEELYDGYEGVVYTKDEYEDVLQEGCAWCSNPFKIGETKPIFISHGQYVCEHCAHVDEVADYLY